MVNIHITLERNEYAAGETAKGTLVIYADKSLRLRGLKFYAWGVENTGMMVVKQYASQIPLIARTYR